MEGRGGELGEEVGKGGGREGRWWEGEEVGVDEVRKGGRGLGIRRGGGKMRM